MGIDGRIYPVAEVSKKEARKPGELDFMDDWYPVRLAPQDGTPVNLWIEDAEAPPTYPVTVGVWETDDITRRSHWHLRVRSSI